MLPPAPATRIVAIRKRLLAALPQSFFAITVQHMDKRGIASSQESCSGRNLVSGDHCLPNCGYWNLVTNTLDLTSDLARKPRRSNACGLHCRLMSVQPYALSLCNCLKTVLWYIGYLDACSVSAPSPLRITAWSVYNIFRSADRLCYSHFLVPCHES